MPQYGHSLKINEIHNSIHKYKYTHTQTANDFSIELFFWIFSIFDREPTINGNRGDLRYI